MANAWIETAEQNWGRAHLAFVRKQNKVTAAITADDERDMIIWRFDKCKDLWCWKETLRLHQYTRRVKWKLVTNAGGMAWDSSAEAFGIRADEGEASKEEKTASWENLSWTREED